MRCPSGLQLAPQMVGDPIDAITGAYIDDVHDFIVPSPFAMEWRRHYSTAHLAIDRGLGRGWTHSFDHQLRFDLDGIRYIAPTGTTIKFPSVDHGTGHAARRGYVLVVQKAEGFELRRPTLPPLHFQRVGTAQARLTRIGGPSQAITAGYDLDGVLQSLTDGLGNSIVILREGRRFVAVRLAPRDRSSPVDLVRYHYQGDLLTEVLDAYHHRLRYAYDREARMVRRTDRRGYSFFFRYDDAGRCVHSAGEDGVLEVKFQYFPLEGRTQVTCGDGGVWQYLCDPDRRLTGIVDPAGATRSFVPRKEDGQVEVEVDGAGRKIQYVYGEGGALHGRRDAEERWIVEKRPHRIPANPLEYELGTFGERPFGLPSPRIANPRLPRQVSDALRFSEDPARGQVVDVFTVQGLLLRREREGRARRYGYDPGGNLRWRVDFDGAKTEYDYASFDHRVARMDPLGYVTTFEHTREDELAAATDPRRVRTEFSRDLRGHLVGVTRAGSRKESYVRDGSGRLIEKHDSGGRPLYGITRGPQGEVLERSFASGGFERYQYDDKLQVLVAETPGSVVELEYDALGRRTRDERGGKGVRRVFAGAAPQTLAELTTLGRFVTKYRSSETPDGRETVIVDPTGREHRIRDLGDGVFERILAGGTHEASQYHPAGHCLAKLVYREDGTAPAWIRRYEYSGEGDLLVSNDSARGLTRYAYDAAHRLVAEHPNVAPARKFQHDEAGNILANGDGSALYHPSNLLAVANGRRFEHDARQAVATEAWAGGYRRFVRDERDQLVAVERYRTVSDGRSQFEHTGTWTASYDALNRRIEKNVDGQSTTFYWDTDRLAAEVFPTGTLRVYVYVDALAMTPVLFVDYASVDASPESGAVYAVFANHLGCPEAIQDMSGRWVWKARIEPYGRVHVEVGADFHQPLRWPGHYYDAELALHYNRFRTYSPELGRYLEPDPLGRGGRLENVYQYTRNPLRRVDTRGLCPDGDSDDDDDENNNKDEEKPDEEDPEEKPTAAERLAARRAQQQEDLRAQLLDESIAAAKADGKYDDLTPDDKKYVDEDDENARLAMDRDGNGNFRVNEAQCADKAVEDGVLPGPVRRATGDVDPRESGADFVAGDGSLWDHKDASMGADDIATTAKGSENVLVDCRGKSPADVEALKADVAQKMGDPPPANAGDIKYVT